VIACIQGHKETVSILLSNFASPVLKNKHGETAFDLSAQNLHASIYDTLSSKIGSKTTSSSSTATENYKHLPFKSVLETVYEYQRSSLFSPSSFSAENLTRRDMSFSNPFRHAVMGCLSSLDEIGLPDAETWFWGSQWTLYVPTSIQGEGWEYGGNQVDEDAGVWRLRSDTIKIGGVAVFSGILRRRRWIRVRQRRLVEEQEGAREGGASDGMNLNTVSSREMDYVGRADMIVSTISSSVSKVAGNILVAWKIELKKYEEAIQILLGGIKGL
jgi:hypothetical protein